MKKEYKLEGCTLVLPTDSDMELNVEASKAVSLKRIADILEKLVAQPIKVEQESIFGELFSHLKDSK